MTSLNTTVDVTMYIQCAICPDTCWYVIFSFSAPRFATCSKLFFHLHIGYTYYTSMVNYRLM